VDAARVGVDGVVQLLAQPRHVHEQPLRGGLAQREEQPHLVGGAVETGGELGDVLRQQDAGAGRGQRDADLAAGEDLAGEPAECLADLGAEHHAAHPAHDPGERAGHRGRLGGEGTGHGADDALGERVDEAAPGGQRLLHPLHPGPGDRPVHAGGQLGDLVQPQVGQAEGVGDGGALGVGRRLRPGGQRADRALPRQVPVDRPPGPGHQLLQLGEQRHLGEQLLRRPPAAGTAEESTEPEGVVAGAGPGLVATLGVAVGEAEAEREIAHATTVAARPHPGRLSAGSGRTEAGRFLL
jgi:hypothetical protein